EVTGDLDVAAGYWLLYYRVGVNHVVEDNREPAADVGRGYRPEDRRAALVEVDRHVGPLKLAARTHASVGYRVAGQQHRCLDQVRHTSAAAGRPVKDLITRRRPVAQRI